VSASYPDIYKKNQSLRGVFRRIGDGIRSSKTFQGACGTTNSLSAPRDAVTSAVGTLCPQKKILKGLKPRETPPLFVKVGAVTVKWREIDFSHLLSRRRCAEIFQSCGTNWRVRAAIGDLAIGSPAWCVSLLPRLIAASSAEGHREARPLARPFFPLPPSAYLTVLLGLACCYLTIFFEA